jgi:hypothetical protein
MKIHWTGKVSSDLVRLHANLRPIPLEATVLVIQQLGRAPDRLLDYPRIGEKLEAYETRKVRRPFVGDYEAVTKEPTPPSSFYAP